MRRAILFLGVVTLSIASASAQAQTRTRRRVPSGEVTGLEMGIEGSLAAVPGGRLRWFVTVYEVVRRRELRPSPDTALVVTSSFSRNAPLAEVQTDARGRAAIEVALPEELERAPRLRVEARSPRHVRRVFSVSLQPQTRHEVQLFVDRPQVVPGGTVATFGRVLDRATGRPAANVEVHLSHENEPVRTDAQGVFLGRATAPAEGNFTVSARTDHGSASRPVQVQAAETAPLWVQAAPAREVAQPGDRVPVEVVVRAPNGAPIEGARVRWNSESEDPDPERRIRTDAEGRARVDWLVARVSSEPLRTLTRALSVVAVGRGSVEHSVSLRLARVPVLTAWAVAGGALVPSLPSHVYVRVVRPDGTPVARSAVRLEATDLGGPLQATTDADGVARFDGQLAANRTPDACGGGTALAATLVVDQHRERLCLPVDPDATLTVETAPADGGIEVAVGRGPQVPRSPVEIAALVSRPGGWAPVAVDVLPPDSTGMTLALPEGIAGEVWIRARPILERGGTARGGGTLAWVSAPGASPDLEAGPDGARVGEAAGSDVLVATERGGSESLRAILAGTLGPVGAAVDADRSEGFRAALLAARTPIDDAASAAWREGELVPQPLPQEPVSRGLLRDPWRTQARFIRGRIGRLMRAVERYADEMIPSSLEDVAVRDRRGWRFNRSILEAAIGHAGLGDETAAALDGEPLDIDALTAMDANFTYDRVARRITRERLFRVNVMLRELIRDRGLDLPWALRGDPSELVVTLLEASQMGGVSFTVWPERDMLFDAWGNPFVLRQVRGRGRFAFLQPVEGWELVSAGPDGRPGSGDDLVDPFARVLPSSGIYAEAVGEDILLARLSGVALGRATVSSLAALFEVDPSAAVEGDPTSRRGAWQPLPARVATRMSGAPVTPIRQAIAGRGPHLAWELPPERRAYDVTAVRFVGGGLRTSRAELVAGAPWVADVTLPVALHVGERLRVPVRLTRIGDGPRPRVEVEARGRAVQAQLDGDRLALTATRPGLADVTVRVHIDERTTSTFERRVRVVPDGALRARAAALWTEGDGELAIHTPDEATPWRAHLVLTSPRGWVRGALLERIRERHPETLGWARAMTGREVPNDLMRDIAPGSALGSACAIVTWAANEAHAARVTGGAETLRGALDADLARRASVLVALGPAATRDPEGGDDPISDLIAELRQDGWRTLTRASDRPAVMARMAAGLLLADRDDAAGRLLLDRVEQRLAEDAHGRRWVPGRPERAGDSWIGTVALAIAARQASRDELAEELAQGASARLSRLAHLDEEGAFWALAAGVYGVFGVDGPSEVTVSVNGRAERVVLEDGAAELPLPASATVTLETDAPTLARVEARYLVPQEPREGGPLRARLEGTPGREGQTSGYELVVENATDRDVGAPIVEVSLPGAARCDEACRARLEASEVILQVGPPDLAGVLRLRLAPVPARSERRVPVPFLWIAAGEARGLALTAYDIDHPEALFVAAPRALQLEEAP